MTCAVGLFFLGISALRGPGSNSVRCRKFAVDPRIRKALAVLGPEAEKGSACREPFLVLENLGCLAQSGLKFRCCTFIVPLNVTCQTFLSTLE